MHTRRFMIQRASDTNDARRLVDGEQAASIVRQGKGVTVARIRIVDVNRPDGIAGPCVFRNGEGRGPDVDRCFVHVGNCERQGLGYGGSLIAGCRHNDACRRFRFEVEASRRRQHPGRRVEIDGTGRAVGQAQRECLARQREGGDCSNGRTRRRILGERAARHKDRDAFIRTKRSVCEDQRFGIYNRICPVTAGHAVRNADCSIVD